MIHCWVRIHLPIRGRRFDPLWELRAQNAVGKLSPMQQLKPDAAKKEINILKFLKTTATTNLCSEGLFLNSLPTLRGKQSCLANHTDLPGAYRAAFRAGRHLRSFSSQDRRHGTDPEEGLGGAGPSPPGPAYSGGRHGTSTEREDQRWAGAPQRWERRDASLHTRALVRGIPGSQGYLLAVWVHLSCSARRRAANLPLCPGAEPPASASKFGVSGTFFHQSLLSLLHGFRAVLLMLPAHCHSTGSGH